MIHRRRRNRPGKTARGPRVASPAPARPPGGFTLVELLVVIVIISILLGFILNAAMNSVNRAKERATQSLITKLETGLNDRLSALLQTRPSPNTAHVVLSISQNQTGTGNSLAYSPRLDAPQRAQVIAWYDYIKRYIPDTFYVQNATPSASNGVYPLNFAANPYPIGGSTSVTNGLYVLPMGLAANGVYGDNGGGGYSLKNTTGLMQYNPTGDGIYGAAYSVAAGIYKNLGYLPQGYDGVDNDGNGTVDDALEGIGTDPQVPSPDDPGVQINLSQLIATRLGNHEHVTARAEMLYALLVEGQGPLGSVFDADEFTDREVQDTDQDGLPECVDAWGKPLQFFRWPLLYHSDLQKGQVITPSGGESWTLQPPYYDPMNPTSTTTGMFMVREQDPLDLNQQLMAPLWWSSTYNNSSHWIDWSAYASLPDSGLGVSNPALAFEYYFHRLCEPMPKHAAASDAHYWDRGSNYPNRRAFYHKFLILSAGLDGQYGVFLYSDANLASAGNPAWALIANENNAMPFSTADVDFTSTPSYGSTTISYSESPDPTNPSTGDLMQFAGDDITNHNIQITVGIGGGQ